MKQKDVFKKIGGIIQELSDQYEYLETINGELNDLELELFVANAHFLTDHIEILCKLNLQHNTLKRPAERQETTYEQKYFEPMVQQMKHATGLTESMPEKAPLKLAETDFAGANTAKKELLIPAPPVPKLLPDADLAEAATTENIAHELSENETLPVHPNNITGEDDNIKQSAATQPAVPESAGPAETTNEEATVDAGIPANSATNEVLTINQKMSSQLAGKAAARTEQLSIKPISDIKLAITLNDKLLYVKDLFNGYNLAYSEAIEILNRFSTFDEAMRFLKTNYITKNNWEGKPATTEKFYALLKRRYA